MFGKLTCLTALFLGGIVNALSQEYITKDPLLRIEFEQYVQEFLKLEENKTIDSSASYVLRYFGNDSFEHNIYPELITDQRIVDINWSKVTVQQPVLIYDHDSVYRVGDTLRPLSECDCGVDGIRPVPRFFGARFVVVRCPDMVAAIGETYRRGSFRTLYLEKID